MTEIYYLIRGKKYAEAKRYSEPTDCCYWTVFIDSDWKFETVLTMNFFNGDLNMPPGYRWEVDELSPETGETIWIRPCTVNRDSKRFQPPGWRKKWSVKKKKAPSAETPGDQEGTVINGDNDAEKRWQ